jgi:hypothetical protein
MKFAPDSLTNWIQLAFTVIAGVYALYLFRQSNLEKRNQFVLDILNRLYNDLEIREIIYAVDSGTNLDEIKYGGDLEQQADKTIQYFDYIGYLIRKKSIRLIDVKPFKYEITRILNNTEVIAYINWLRGIGVSLDNLKYLHP